MYLFTGRGVEIPQEKNSSLQGEIQKLSLSSRLEVPLYTLGRTQLELTVGVGEPIRKYAPLALSPSRNHAILSPVSGKLMGVDSRIHPLLGKVPCALIQADPEGREEKIRPQWETGMGYDKLERIAREAGIVDETDHSPLYRKLRTLRQRDVYKRQGQRRCFYGKKGNRLFFIYSSGASRPGEIYQAFDS